MPWLGDIQNLLKVAVGYRGIRVCLEEVDQVILGGNANLLKIESLESQFPVFDIASHICSTLIAYFSFLWYNRIIWAGTQRNRKHVTTIHEG